MTMVHLQTLGALVVRVDGKPITRFRSDKIRALLIYLAVESDRPHRREFLATLLWPHMERAIGLRNLRNSLSRLRQSLGAEASDQLLLSHRQTIGMNRNGIEVDVLVFNKAIGQVATHAHTAVAECIDCIEKLEEALKWYRGEFLSGFLLADAPHFSDWIRQQRELWHQRYVATLQSITAVFIEQAQWQQALLYAQQQVAAEPWREIAYRQLMQIYAGLGQMKAVRDQYERCRQQLNDEFGVAPSAQTTALYEQLMPTAVPAPHAADRSPPKPPQLPRPFTSFVGRKKVLQEINGRLDNPSCALLTLLGPGGAGKTRVSIEIARQRAEAYRDGIIFVPLALVTEAADIPDAIIEAINLLLMDKQDSQTQLLNYFREKELLLILDNFEHLLAGASLVMKILEAAPGVNLLITSRSALNLRAEWLYELTGLSTPAGDGNQDFESATAVQLFIERLAQLHTSETLKQQDKEAISRTCRLVEGIPLAIELAASQSRLSSITAVADALENSMDAIRTEMVDVPPRQRSMRAVFDYSWQTLNEQEQFALMRVSVFVGGFFVAAAAVVADAPAAWLESLQDKSFLQQTAVNRYGMHEVLRQFAREQITAAKLEEAVLQKHSQYYLGTLSRQESQMVGREGQTAMAKLQIDLANILQAWDNACQHGAFDLLKQSQYAMSQFLHLRRLPTFGQRVFSQAASFAANFPVAEGEQLQTQLLLAQFLNEQARFLVDLGQIDAAAAKAKEALAIAQAKEFQREKALALTRIGITHKLRSEYDKAHKRFDEGEEILNELVAQAHANQWKIRNLQSVIYKQKCDAYWDVGHFEKATSYVEKALALDIENKNVPGEAGCFHRIGYINKYQGNYDQAIMAFEKSMALAQLAGDIHLQHLLLNSLALTYSDKGDNETAKIYFEEFYQISKEMGALYSQATSLTNLGLVAARQGAYLEAESYYEQALILARQAQGKRDEGVLLGNLGVIAMLLGNFERADQLFGQSLKIRLEINNRTGEKYAHFYIARLALYQGDYATAVSQSQQVLELAAEDSVQEIDFLARTTLGHAYLNLNRPDQAKPLYEEAIEHWQKQGQVHLMLAPMSGLARMALLAGDLEQAVTLCNQILEHAPKCDLESTFEPFAIWYVCIEVLLAAGDKRAKLTLLEAHGRLQARAARLPDLEIKAQFLHNIPAHKEIARLAQQMNDEGETGRSDFAPEVT